MSWPFRDDEDKWLYDRLGVGCGRGGCTTCGGGAGLVRWLIERYGSEQALEHRLARFPVRRLERLLERTTFFQFLNDLSLPVWARMAWRLSDRCPHLMPNTTRWDDSWGYWGPGRPSSVRDCMVWLRAWRNGNQPRPSMPRRCPPWTRALYEDLIREWERREAQEAAHEAYRREAEERERRKLEEWRAATPNWREIEAAQRAAWVAEARQRRMEQLAPLRAEQELQAFHRARRMEHASIGLRKAIERDDTRRITALLAKGADPHYRFENGFTALDYAAHLGQEASLALLRRSAAAPTTTRS